MRERERRRPVWPSVEAVDAAQRPRIRAEVWLVLGVTLGQSAVYAVLSLLNKLTETGGLGSQTTTLNASASPKPWFDFIVQVTQIAFGVVPVLLVLWLLGQSLVTTGTGIGVGARRLGLGALARPRTWAQGLGLAALIGIPGLGLYAAGRALGLTAGIVPSGLGSYWWSVPVLIASALQAALVEETIVAGWLVIRLRELGRSWVAVFAITALLRGSYHLYQGFGPFVGNAIMGIVFVWFARRFGGVGALIVAHLVLDVVAFVGWQLLGPWLTSAGLLG